MEQLGTLQIWIAINTLTGRSSFRTIETVHDVTERQAREEFKTWQNLNPHMPHAGAKWVPPVVIIR